MKIVSTLFTGAALVFATGAMAPAHAQMQADTMTQADTTFSDAQIESFAAAAIKLQAMEGGPAANQQAAAKIVMDSGLEPQTFNAIAQALQTDPEVAQRVQVAVAAIQNSAG